MSGLFQKNVSPIDTYIDNIEVTDLNWMNPEMPGFTEAYISFVPRDKITMKLLFYFGHGSQMVDIYAAIYDNNNLYFFPDWTTKTQKITLFLPQFTMLSDWIDIMEYEIGELPLVSGESLYTIGIAPAGTMDFFHELDVRTYY